MSRGLRAMEEDGEASCSSIVVHNAADELESTMITHTVDMNHGGYGHPNRGVPSGGVGGGMPSSSMNAALAALRSGAAAAGAHSEASSTGTFVARQPSPRGGAFGDSGGNGLSPGAGVVSMEDNMAAALAAIRTKQHPHQQQPSAGQGLGPRGHDVSENRTSHRSGARSSSGRTRGGGAGRGRSGTRGTASRKAVSETARLRERFMASQRALEKTAGKAAHKEDAPSASPATATRSTEVAAPGTSKDANLSGGDTVNASESPTSSPAISARVAVSDGRPLPPAGRQRNSFHYHHSSNSISYTGKDADTSLSFLQPNSTASGGMGNQSTSMNLSAPSARNPMGMSTNQFNITTTGGLFLLSPMDRDLAGAAAAMPSTRGGHVSGRQRHASLSGTAAGGGNSSRYPHGPPYHHRMESHVGGAGAPLDLDDTANSNLLSSDGRGEDADGHEGSGVRHRAGVSFTYIAVEPKAEYITFGGQLLAVPSSALDGATSDPRQGLHVRGAASSRGALGGRNTRGAMASSVTGGSGAAPGGASGDAHASSAAAVPVFFSERSAMAHSLRASPARQTLSPGAGSSVYVPSPQYSPAQATASLLLPSRRNTTTTASAAAANTPLAGAALMAGSSHADPALSLLLTSGLYSSNQQSRSHFTPSGALTPLAFSVGLGPLGYSPMSPAAAAGSYQLPASLSKRGSALASQRPSALSLQTPAGTRGLPEPVTTPLSLSSRSPPADHTHTLTRVNQRDGTVEAEGATLFGDRRVTKASQAKPPPAPALRKVRGFSAAAAVATEEDEDNDEVRGGGATGKPRKSLRSKSTTKPSRTSTDTSGGARVKTRAASSGDVGKTRAQSKAKKARKSRSVSTSHKALGSPGDAAPVRHTDARPRFSEGAAIRSEESADSRSRLVSRGASFAITSPALSFSRSPGFLDNITGEEDTPTSVSARQGRSRVGGPQRRGRTTSRAPSMAEDPSPSSGFAARQSRYPAEWVGVTPQQTEESVFAGGGAGNNVSFPNVSSSWFPSHNNMSFYGPESRSPSIGQRSPGRTPAVGDDARQTLLSTVDLRSAGGLSLAALVSQLDVNPYAALFESSIAQREGRNVRRFTRVEKGRLEDTESATSMCSVRTFMLTAGLLSAVAGQVAEALADLQLASVVDVRSRLRSTTGTLPVDRTTGGDNGREFSPDIVQPFSDGGRPSSVSWMPQSADSRGTTKQGKEVDGEAVEPEDACLSPGSTTTDGAPRGRWNSGDKTTAPISGAIDGESSTGTPLHGPHSAYGVTKEMQTFLIPSSHYLAETGGTSMDRSASGERSLSNSPYHPPRERRCTMAALAESEASVPSPTRTGDDAAGPLSVKEVDRATSADSGTVRVSALKAHSDAVSDASSRAVGAPVVAFNDFSAGNAPRGESGSPHKSSGTMDVDAKESPVASALSGQPQSASGSPLEEDVLAPGQSMHVRTTTNRYCEIDDSVSHQVAHSGTLHDVGKDTDATSEGAAPENKASSSSSCSDGADHTSESDTLHKTMLSDGNTAEDVVTLTRPQSSPSVSDQPTMCHASPDRSDLGATPAILNASAEEEELSVKPEIKGGRKWVKDAISWPDLSQTSGAQTEATRGPAQPEGKTEPSPGHASDREAGKSLSVLDVGASDLVVTDAFLAELADNLRAVFLDITGDTSTALPVGAGFTSRQGGHLLQNAGAVNAADKRGLPAFVADAERTRPFLTLPVMGLEVRSLVDLGESDAARRAREQREAEAAAVQQAAVEAKHKASSHTAAAAAAAAVAAARRRRRRRRLSTALPPPTEEKKAQMMEAGIVLAGPQPLRRKPSLPSFHTRKPHPKKSSPRGAGEAHKAPRSSVKNGKTRGTVRRRALGRTGSSTTTNTTATAGAEGSAFSREKTATADGELQASASTFTRVTTTVPRTEERSAEDQSQHSAEEASVLSGSAPVGLPSVSLCDPNRVLALVAMAMPQVQQGNIREQWNQFLQSSNPSIAQEEFVLRNIVYGVLQRLVALHDAGMAHGSVKPTNVFSLQAARRAAEENRRPPLRPLGHRCAAAEAHERKGRRKGSLNSDAPPPPPARDGEVETQREHSDGKDSDLNSLHATSSMDDMRAVLHMFTTSSGTSPATTTNKSTVAAMGAAPGTTQETTLRDDSTKNVPMGATTDAMGTKNDAEDGARVSPATTSNGGDTVAVPLGDRDTSSSSSVFPPVEHSATPAPPATTSATAVTVTATTTASTTDEDAASDAPIVGTSTLPPTPSSPATRAAHAAAQQQRKGMTVQERQIANRKLRAQEKKDAVAAAAVGAATSLTSGTEAMRAGAVSVGTETPPPPPSPTQARATTRSSATSKEMRESLEKSFPSVLDSEVLASHTGQLSAPPPLPPPTVVPAPPASPTTADPSMSLHSIEDGLDSHLLDQTGTDIHHASDHDIDSSEEDPVQHAENVRQQNIEQAVGEHYSLVVEEGNITPPGTLRGAESASSQPPQRRRSTPTTCGRPLLPPWQVTRRPVVFTENKVPEAALKAALPPSSVATVAPPSPLPAFTRSAGASVSALLDAKEWSKDVVLTDSFFDRVEHVIVATVAKHILHVRGGGHEKGNESAGEASNDAKRQALLEETACDVAEKLREVSVADNRPLWLFPLDESELMPPPESFSPDWGAPTDNSPTDVGNSNVSNFAAAEGGWGASGSSSAVVRLVPNTFRPAPLFTAAADVWQLGMLLLSLADNTNQFDRRTQTPSSYHIRSKRVDLSDCFHRFLERCLQPDPRRRPTARELLRDEWFYVALDQHSGLNCVVPRRVSQTDGSMAKASAEVGGEVPPYPPGGMEVNAHTTGRAHVSSYGTVQIRTRAGGGVVTRGDPRAGGAAALAGSRSSRGLDATEVLGRHGAGALGTEMSRGMRRVLEAEYALAESVVRPAQRRPPLSAGEGGGSTRSSSSPVLSQAAGTSTGRAGSEQGVLTLRKRLYTSHLTNLSLMVVFNEAARQWVTTFQPWRLRRNQRIASRRMGSDPARGSNPPSENAVARNARRQALGGGSSAAAAASSTAGGYPGAQGTSSAGWLPPTPYESLLLHPSALDPPSGHLDSGYRGAGAGSGATGGYGGGGGGLLPEGLTVAALAKQREALLQRFMEACGDSMPEATSPFVVNHYSWLCFMIPDLAVLCPTEEVYLRSRLSGLDLEGTRRAVAAAMAKRQSSRSSGITGVASSRRPLVMLGSLERNGSPWQSTSSARWGQPQSALRSPHSLRQDGNTLRGSWGTGGQGGVRASEGTDDSSDGMVLRGSARASLASAGGVLDVPSGDEASLRRGAAGVGGFTELPSARNDLTGASSLSSSSRLYSDCSSTTPSASEGTSRSCSPHSSGEAIRKAAQAAAEAFSEREGTPLSSAILSIRSTPADRELRARHRRPSGHTSVPKSDNVLGSPGHVRDDLRSPHSMSAFGPLAHSSSRPPAASVPATLRRSDDGGADTRAGGRSPPSLPPTLPSRSALMRGMTTSTDREPSSTLPGVDGTSSLEGSHVRHQPRSDSQEMSMPIREATSEVALASSTPAFGATGVWADEGSTALSLAAASSVGSAAGDVKRSVQASTPLEQSQRQRQRSEQVTSSQGGSGEAGDHAEPLVMSVNSTDNAGAEFGNTTVNTVTPAMLATPPLSDGPISGSGREPGDWGSRSGAGLLSTLPPHVAAERARAGHPVLPHPAELSLSLDHRTHVKDQEGKMKKRKSRRSSRTSRLPGREADMAPSFVGIVTTALDASSRACINHHENVKLRERMTTTAARGKTTHEGESSTYRKDLGEEDEHEDDFSEEVTDRVTNLMQTFLQLQQINPQAASLATVMVLRHLALEDGSASLVQHPSLHSVLFRREEDDLVLEAQDRRRREKHRGGVAGPTSDGAAASEEEGTTGSATSGANAGGLSDSHDVGPKRRMPSARGAGPDKPESAAADSSGTTPRPRSGTATPPAASASGAAAVNHVPVIVDVVPSVFHSYEVSKWVAAVELSQYRSEELREYQKQRQQQQHQQRRRR